MSNVSPESRDGSFCVDGKQLSLEGTGKCCTPFLLNLTLESNLDNYRPRQKSKMQCMWQLRFYTRCLIPSMAFFCVQIDGFSIKKNNNKKIEI